MPHIKLEHTENIELSRIKPIFNQLRIILMENAGVKEENCKCKSIYIPVYSVGNNSALRHFYHLEISLLKGRSEEIKQKIGQQSLEFLKKYFTDKNGEDIKQFSLEIREMNPEDYFTSNTL